MDEVRHIDRSEPVYAARSGRVSLYLWVKRFFYGGCKAVGLFALTNRHTRRALRIISYHGFSFADETEFSRRTFINPRTFEKRMAFLRRERYRVLDLGEALDRLKEGTLPPRSVVITIDDGFYGTYVHAFPILRAHSASATVYVTTYYAATGNPVFDLAVQYLFWKTKERVLDLAGLGMRRTGIVSLERTWEKTECLWEIIRFGNTECDEARRTALCRMLGERLGVDYDSLAARRLVSIMNLEEIRELSTAGIDIQLHTHRHSFPRDRTRALREIADNRAALEPFVTKPLVHFCYPSGVWAAEQWPWLSEAGMRSAVTCERGLNYAATPRFGLKRFGDDEGLSEIEFEAELSGFAEILRRLGARLSLRRG
jgi:peptidoglycan/xylan/chitin deacetylase (PgdA/CDA1 family)